MCKKLIHLMLVIVLVLLADMANADITTDLIGYWKLDDNANDSSGNNYHGEEFGSPSYVPGMIGQAMEFNGSQSVYIPEFTGIQNQDEVTVCMWVKADRNTGNDQVMWYTDEDGSYGRVRFGINGDEWEWKHGGDGGNPNVDDGENPIILGEWTHLAGVRKNNDRLELFVNGISVDQTAFGVAGVAEPQGSIGAERGSPTSVKNSFEGTIDEVRIYSRALSSADIQELFAFTGAAPALASNPDPADEATDVPRDVVLGWTPGSFAATHNVYFGTSFDDVYNGIGRVTQDASSYAPPQRLDFNTTYYWRVDEVNAPPDSTVYRGSLWSFTTEPPVVTPSTQESTQVYKRTDDRNLSITLTFPGGWRSEDRRSAIIFFYNGGWKASGASRQFSEQAEYLARRGMVCARADYREKSKGGVTSVKCIEDIDTAIRWLRHSASALGIDPQRIAAAGGSGSIYLLASLLPVKETDAEADDLSISPHPGALFLFDSDLDVLDPAMMQLLIGVAESRDTRRRFPPTIIFYGGRDAMKPYLDDFVSKMKKTGVPIEPFVEEDGLHGAFKFSPWLERTTARMDEQLQTLGFLNPEPRADLPARSKPEGVDQRILENQARWLERHKQLEQSRETPIGKKQAEPVVLRSRSAPATTPPATYTYKTLGKRKLLLAVHYPPGWKKEDRRSAILFFGGGGMNPKDKSGNSYPLAAERARLDLPAVNGGPGAAFMSEAKHFAARGLLCVRAEYRKRKTDGTLPSDAVEDAASAMRWVRNNAVRLGIDPAHIVACGSSSGGHLAASLAALDEFDAADDDRSVSRCPDVLILHSPLLDFLDGGTRTTPFLAAVSNDRTLGERLSPARHWRAGLPPTLIFSGTKEPIFDALQEFAAKWKAARENMGFVAVEGGHVSSLADKSLAQTLTRMEAFLKSVGCWEPKPVGLNSMTAATSAPRVRSDARPDEPAWIINGKNKMPKLLRLLGTTEHVCVIVYDIQGRQVGEIRDVLHQQTDLNELIGPGQYRLKFLDENGNPIRLTQEVADVLRLK